MPYGSKNLAMLQANLTFTVCILVATATGCGSASLRLHVIDPITLQPIAGAVARDVWFSGNGFLQTGWGLIRKEKTYPPTGRDGIINVSVGNADDEITVTAKGHLPHKVQFENCKIFRDGKLTQLPSSDVYVLMYDLEIPFDFRQPVVFSLPELSSQPTGEDMLQFETWSEKAGGIARYQINPYCRNLIEGPLRERFRWMISQYKNAAANGGKWDPPTTNPVAKSFILSGD